jgi:hypothetical protein
MTSVQQRLLMHAARNAATGCWNWSGQVSNSGHGRTKVRAADGTVRMQSAEDASYEAFIGPVPVGKLVRQRCNNPLCINPEHLELFDPAMR